MSMFVNDDQFMETITKAHMMAEDERVLYTLAEVAGVVIRTYTVSQEEGMAIERHAFGDGERVVHIGHIRDHHFVPLIEGTYSNILSVC